MEPITASKLRSDVYRLLDEVLETGVPVEILRRGRLLRIVRAGAGEGSKLSRLVAHPDSIRGDAEAIAEIDWSTAWRP